MKTKGTEIKKGAIVTALTVIGIILIHVAIAGLALWVLIPKGDKPRGPVDSGSGSGTEKPIEHEHEWVTDVGVTPTCTESGLTEGSHCAICGKILVAREDLAATGHSWERWTEQGDGTIVRTCSKDKRHKTVVCLPGHEKYNAAEWSMSELAATCTESGTRAYRHKTYESLIWTKDVAATGHTVVTDEAVAATCTAPGKTAGSHCATCGNVLVEQEEIAALGHDRDAAGKCTRCGDQVTVTQTVSDGFELGYNGVYTLEAENMNLNGARAEYDGATFVEVPVNPEETSGGKDVGSLGQWSELTAAFTTTREMTVTITAVLANSNSNYTLSGNVKFYIDGEELTAWNCSFGPGETATYTNWQEVGLGEKQLTAGEHTFKVSVTGSGCNMDCFRFTVPAAECLHEETILTGGKEATCTEAGYTQRTECAVCGTVIKESTTIPVKAHKYDEKGTCTVCGIGRNIDLPFIEL